MTVADCTSTYDDPEDELEELEAFGVQHFHHQCARELPHRTHGCGLCATEWVERAISDDLHDSDRSTEPDPIVAD